MAELIVEAEFIQEKESASLTTQKLNIKKQICKSRSKMKSWK